MQFLQPLLSGHPLLSEHFWEGPKGVCLIEVSLYLDVKADIIFEYFSPYCPFHHLQVHTGH